MYTLPLSFVPELYSLLSSEYEFRQVMPHFQDLRA